MLPSVQPPHPRPAHRGVEPQGSAGFAPPPQWKAALDSLASSTLAGRSRAGMNTARRPETQPSEPLGLRSPMSLCQKFFGREHLLNAHAHPPPQLPPRPTNSSPAWPAADSQPAPRLAQPPKNSSVGEGPSDVPSARLDRSPNAFVHTNNPLPRTRPVQGGQRLPLGHVSRTWEEPMPGVGAAFISLVKRLHWGRETSRPGLQTAGLT